MRLASPNEVRTISREDLGLYNAVVVGGVYEFDRSEVDPKSPRSFIGPLQHCIDTHPPLSVVIKDKHTDKPFYERVPTVDLHDHISIMNDDRGGRSNQPSSETVAIEQVLPYILDQPLPSSSPPWRLVVLPLSSPEADRSRCLVVFAFSHALADGIGGLAFHRTFLAALRSGTNGHDTALYDTPKAELKPPFDTPERLPISWGFLLAPLLATILPQWIADKLGLRADVAGVNPGTWTGSPIFCDPNNLTSRVKLLEINASKLRGALARSKENGAKLTAVIHQLIVRAVSMALPDREATNFVSQTAVNMRRALGISGDEMGLFVNGYYETHPRVDGPDAALSDEAWAAARSMTAKLVESATTLADQPLGLLRYVPSMRKWTTGKLGQRRDCSWEVSNLGAVCDTEANRTTNVHRCKMTKMLFCQPANPTGPPIAFNVASVDRGSLLFAISWQSGALGMPEDAEREFIDAVSTSIRDGFYALGREALSGKGF
ncbi:hypothetical protein DL771_008306 [Monosporascus sp. 5C6A]|nr:hypothetical protein DL771_008306 [Monosporascus sp. 5C6A]